jgi:hypothetical protein
MARGDVASLNVHPFIWTLVTNVNALRFFLLESHLCIYLELVRELDAMITIVLTFSIKELATMLSGSRRFACSNSDSACLTDLMSNSSKRTVGY